MEYNLEIISTKCYRYFNAYNLFETLGQVWVQIIDEDNKKVKVIYVKTNIEHVGKGVASFLINKVLEMFRDYDIYLNVVPMPRPNVVKDYKNVKDLVKFYSKFGFVLTDDPCIPTMVKKN